MCIGMEAGQGGAYQAEASLSLTEPSIVSLTRWGRRIREPSDTNTSLQGYPLTAWLCFGMKQRVLAGADFSEVAA